MAWVRLAKLTVAERLEKTTQIFFNCLHQEMWTALGVLLPSLLKQVNGERPALTSFCQAYSPRPFHSWEHTSGSESGSKVQSDHYFGGDRVF